MNKWRHAFRNLMVIFCIGICMYCVGMEVIGFSPQAGVNAVLYAAGLEKQDKQERTENKDEKIGLTEKKVTAQENPEGIGMVIMEEDGIVPFHDGELPQITATPEPGRNSLPVQEIAANGGQQVGNFFVKDTSSAGLNLVEELQLDPAVDIKANGEIEVLLYHTHTSESYMEGFTGFYYTDMQTRSHNQEKGVVAVGEEIKAELEKAGIGVIHDTSVNDTMFNGSYSRSWETLQRNLAEHPGIQVTIDIHRDSMTTAEGVKYKPTAEIDGRRAAQIMVMTGCDQTGDWGDYPDWRENLHLALRLQEKAQEMYPGLMRPLNFSDSKYNMNATKGSLLIEVGTEVSTVAEAKYSGKMMGKILAELLPTLKKTAE